jgi:hypothetical protein
MHIVNAAALLLPAAALLAVHLQAQQERWTSRASHGKLDGERALLLAS